MKDNYILAMPSIERSGYKDYFLYLNGTLHDVFKSYHTANIALLRFLNLPRT